MYLCCVKLYGYITIMCIYTRENIYMKLTDT